MTLTNFYGQYDELFEGCILHWTGEDQTNLGFPILPSGVTVSPQGSWTSDLDLLNNKTLKTFDGSTNYISLTDNDAWNIDTTSDFSISFWIKLDNVSSAVGICGQYIDTSNFFGIVFENSTHNIFIALKTSNTIRWKYSTASNSITTINTWYHIVIFRTSNTWKSSTDGVITNATPDPAQSAAYNIAAPLLIGKYYTSIEMYGNIKDFMWFTRALSAPEIKQIMTLSHPTTGRNDFYPTLSGIRGCL